MLLEIPAEAFKAAVPFLILAACALLLLQDPVRAALLRRAAARAGAAEDVAGAVTTVAEAPLPGVAVAEAALSATAAGAPAGVVGAGGPAGAGVVGLGGDGSGARAEMLPERPAPRLAELLAVLACAVYGGFFGAGLGIMLLAVLGLFSTTSLARTNAVKQALSLVINAIAALFFAFSGKVDWVDAGLIALAAMVGASIGGRLVRRIDPRVLRALVVLLGLSVAIRAWV